MLSVITIEGRQIVVETEPAVFPPPPKGSIGLPRGAEPTGFQDSFRDGAKLIEDTIGAISSTVIKALKNLEPQECSVEIGFAFKGEHSPIPVLVKVGGEASIKVTAKWEKHSSEA